MQSSVPQSDTELGEFLLRACHDLRAPLRAARTHSELLGRHASQDDSQSIGFIVNGTAEAGLVIDGLTDYALALQIDSAAFLPVPMGVMLRASLAKLAVRIAESGAEVVHDPLPTVPGNADRLMQLFELLVDNALRNRGSCNPRVEITAEQRDDGWLFRVHDNGKDVEAEFLEKLFKPFERIRGKERPGPGLAVCRVIVERHRGSMWAEPSTQGGCTLCFLLPAE